MRERERWEESERGGGEGGEGGGDVRYFEREWGNVGEGGARERERNTNNETMSE